MQSMAQKFPEAIGRALRRARRDRGLTLDDVEVRSRGRFKRSAVGGYERGERQISLSRFCELAAVYNVSPGHLLTKALQQGAQVPPVVVIDLARLSRIEDEDVWAVAQLVQDLKVQRGDLLTDVITLRAGDLEILATAFGEKSSRLLEKLRPALRKPHR